MSMMRVSCEDCGSVDLLPRQLAVIRDEERQISYYRFRCPSICGRIVLKRTHSRTRDLMMAYGVEDIKVNFAEAREAEGAPNATPLTALSHDATLGLMVDAFIDSCTLPDAVIYEEAHRSRSTTR